MPALKPRTTTKTCRRCRRKEEVFHYLDNMYQFDIDRARALAGDGREPVEVDDESVRTAVDKCVIDEGHVPHVDPAVPGIITQVFYVDADGKEVQAYLLIDGHHRAARCLKEGRVFQAYLLDEAESRQIVLRSPDRPVLTHTLVPPPEESSEAGDLHPPTTRAYIKKFTTSRPLSRRSHQVIAGATTHDRRGFGPFGVYVDRADGPRKWDVAGQPLIDLWMGHGALLCGHNFPPVVEAVTRQIARGTHYGASHELEVRWAELVCRMIPSAERVRFTASGTEATMLALRVARAFTGRPRVLKFDGHFHGWHDEAMGHFYDADAAGFNPAAVERVALADPLDASTVERELAKGDVAGVLLEPGGGSSGGYPWGKPFLQAVREITSRHGTLLLFDEVISGFRHGVGGVQEAVGVTPDVTTLAKILAGGLPAGAVAGRADVMAVFGDGTRIGGRRAQVPHTGTFNANPLSAAAGIAMLEHVADGKHQALALRAAERLAEGINRAARRRDVDVLLYTNGTSIYHILIGAHNTRSPLGPSPAVAHLNRVNPRKYALLRRALLVEGVDTHPVHGWLSSTHTDAVIDEVVDAFDRAFRRTRNAPGFRLLDD